WFHCRKNKLHIANASHGKLLLISVVNAWFHFRPNTPLRQTPVISVFASGRSKPDRLERQTRPILQSRSQLGPLPSGPFVNPFRVGWENPGLSVLIACFLHDFRVIRSVSEDNDLGVIIKRQRAYHFCGGFGGGQVNKAMLGTVFLRSVRNLHRDANP